MTIHTFLLKKAQDVSLFVVYRAILEYIIENMTNWFYISTGFQNLKFLKLNYLIYQNLMPKFKYKFEINLQLKIIGKICRYPCSISLKILESMQPKLLFFRPISIVFFKTPPTNFYSAAWVIWSCAYLNQKVYFDFLIVLIS